MLSLRFCGIALPILLGMTPAMVVRNHSDVSSDCFDVAAPMAEATPCFEGGHHTHRHSARQDRNTPQKGADKSTRLPPKSRLG
jgi:hypothetical protein